MKVILQKALAVLLVGVVASQPLVVAVHALTQDTWEEMAGWMSATSEVHLLAGKAENVYAADADEFRRLINRAIDGEDHSRPFAETDDIFYIGYGWGGGGIIAKDAFRAGHLVSLAYEAGLVERVDAYLLMEPAANILRLGFSGWGQALENYFDGLLFCLITCEQLPFEDALEQVEEHRQAISVLQAEREYLFDDEFFYNLPTVNLGRVEAPTRESVSGYWYVSSGELSAAFYFGEGGSVTYLMSFAGDEFYKFTGAYSFDERGRLSNTFYNVDAGEGFASVEWAEWVRPEVFIGMWADGEGLIVVWHANGRPSLYERSDGEFVARFRRTEEQ